MYRTEQRALPSRGLGQSAGQSFPALFSVEASSSSGEAVLWLHGELDMSTRPLFASTLAGIDESVGRVILDLSHLTFIDCGNIGLICRYRIRAGLRGTQLELRNANPHMRRILELTGLSASKGDGMVRPMVQPMPARAYDRPNGREIHLSDPMRGDKHAISYTR